MPSATNPRVIAVPVEPPPGGRAEVVGTALRIIDADGGFVMALRASQPGSSLEVRAGLSVAVLPPGPPTSVTVETTSRLVEATTWVRRGAVRSLRVTPTWAARGPAGGDAVWVQLRAARPEADTPGMRDQLVCHVNFAVGKPEWFLEPARPAVGYAATVLAACNPGDIPDGG